MRQSLTIIVAFILQLSLHAQPQTQPMPDNIFYQELNRMKVVKQDQKLLSMANNMARRNNLLTSQAKQVARLFTTDYFRLEFLQVAYPSIYDKENVYDLYDSFSAFSAVMRFHDFMEQSDKPNRKKSRYRDYNGKDFSFPAYNYPSYDDYENSRCESPMNDEEFEDAVVEILSYRDDDTRIKGAVALAETNCMSVSQIMKLGCIIEKEQKRLEYMKRTYDYAYDVDNFSYGNQLFKEKTYLTDFDTFVKGRRTPDDRGGRGRRPEVIRCQVTDAEMSDIAVSLRKQSFDNTRMDVAKQVVRAKKCFSVTQIEQLMKNFDFDNTRLELAKFCYDYCINRSDYYKLNDLFAFSKSVDELNKYISERGN
jgi:hypothetical protein